MSSRKRILYPEPSDTDNTQSQDSSVASSSRTPPSLTSSDEKEKPKKRVCRQIMYSSSEEEEPKANSSRKEESSDHEDPSSQEEASSQEEKLYDDITPTSSEGKCKKDAKKFILTACSSADESQSSSLRDFIDDGEISDESDSIYRQMGTRHSKAIVCNFFQPYKDTVEEDKETIFEFEMRVQNDHDSLSEISDV